jgi:F-type H+-transporting ATPase subunit c
MLRNRTTQVVAGLGAFLMLLAFPLMGFAQEGAEAAGGANQLIALAAGLAIAVAAFGGALSQARAAAAALEGMARNPGIQPKLFVAMILALALIESLVLYALLIAIMLMGKV